MSDSSGNIVQGLFSAEDWQGRLVRNPASGRTTDCWQNVYTICEWHPAWRGVLGFDEFAQEIVKRKPAPYGGQPGRWGPEDDRRASLWMSQQLAFTPKALGTIADGVAAVAQEHPFHPVRDWLEHLTWDRTPRLETWLHELMGTEASPYTQAVGRYFIVNMVARVFEPGCIMRSVPVFEGAQNRGKSTAMRILGGEWFSDASLDIGSRDAFELIQGVWLHEIGEMASFNRIEANKVKHFVSQRENAWVPKYVRGRVKVQRQVCFVGTTNESLYLRDWTGNTRFWPVRCEASGEIRLDLIEAAREQLFAEAVILYREGARRHPTREEERELFEPQQEERRTEHPWKWMIAEWLDKATFEWTTTSAILTDCLGVERARVLDTHEATIGRLMAQLGWERRREPRDAAHPDRPRGWRYVRPRASSDAVAQHDDGAPQEGISTDEPVPF